MNALRAAAALVARIPEVPLSRVGAQLHASLAPHTDLGVIAGELAGAVTTAAEVDRHAQTVRALSAPGAPLHRASPHAPIKNPVWFFTPGVPTPMREELHQQILGRFRAMMETEVAQTSARSSSPGRPAPASHASLES